MGYVDLSINALAVLALVCFTALAYSSTQSLVGRLSPGPKGWPLIGNVLDMPSSHEWISFAKWRKVYGDIISVKLFGQPIIILNSVKAATDLLDERSAIYSDRPTLVVAGEYVGYDQTLPFTRYGQKFRDLRRMLSTLIGSKGAMAAFVPLIEHETRHCMLGLLGLADQGDVDLDPPIRKCASAIVMSMAYGYTVVGDDDPFIRLVGTVMDEFSIVATPGAFPVDTFPILRYIPEWLPGGRWKKLAKQWKTNLRALGDELLEYVKQQMSAGTHKPSFSSRHLENCKDSEREELIKMSARAVWGGGSDTTVSANRTFVLMLLLHPDMQKKAQAELDAVVGNGRLPELADRNQLPYLSALHLECLRYHPVAPAGGMPHRSTEDDVYDGYVIPKGATVISNIWAMCHEESTYADPHSFNPHRFMASENKMPERDPRDIVFGFGRRVCPGSRLADYATFIFAATILALYDILPAKSEPLPHVDDYSYTSGVVSHPPLFKCTLRPRSPQAEALIRSIALQS